MKIQFFHIIFLMLITTLCIQAQGQEDIIKREGAFYEIKEVPIPDEVLLEVGGLAFTDDGKLGVTTRRGELWLIDRPASQNPKYSLFASGMHEPLWLAYRKGSFYASQRGEITKITDTNNDGKGDLFKTIYSWPLSGNYHEYSYGPLFLPNGDMIVTLNLSWEGKGKSLAKWRGWMLKITEDGEMEPYATGLRSPAAMGLNAEGDIFYSENQGDWIGSGFVTHVEKGDFTGNPAGLRWAGEPDSPLSIPEDLFSSDSVGTMYEFSKSISSVKLPTVWFPHTILGISTSGLLNIDNDQFGPFKGQMLVGDQGHSKIMRMFLEKVDGEYQGACFPFREGFESGILRLAWGNDNSLYVGMTSRGWASTGGEEFGLQRLVWNGKTPFEMKAIRAVADGFEIEFTEPVDPKTAADPTSYQLTGFTYSYHRKYGSPIIQQKGCPVVNAEVSEDGRKVRLSVRGLREGFVHEVKAVGVNSRQGKSLLHNVGYYTLNNMPEGSGHAGHMMAEEDNAEGNARSCGADPSKNVTAQPADWTDGADVVINIGTKPGLKFDIDEFEVPAGAKVKLVFTNDDDMLHNLVITSPGAGNKVGKKAMEMGLNGSSLGYVPASEDVLFNTCIIEPETSQSIYFVAPEAGEYTFVCTFPGHYMNMQGIMKVVDESAASTK